MSKGGQRVRVKAVRKDKPDIRKLARVLIDQARSDRRNREKQSKEQAS